MGSESARRVAALDDSIIDGSFKAWPDTLPATRLGEVGSLALSIARGDLLFPVAVLRESALSDNARWMRSFLQATGARLAPHGKTTLSPQLFQRQLDDGAWAITVATVAQLQLCRRFGFDRLVLANQLVDEAALAVVMAELSRDPAFELYSLADSLAGVQRVAAAARRTGQTRPVRLLVEVGFEGGRTGCRSADDALAVARAIAAEPSLALCGVEAFEGLIHSDDHDADARRVCALLDEQVAVARACAAERLFAPGPVLLSAGGSAYYDLVAEHLNDSGVPDAQVLLRCGCYVTHDSAVYEGAFAALRQRSATARSVDGGLRHALEVWAVVQSRPERHRAILTVGKRDVGADLGPPVPLWYCRPGAAPAPLRGHAVVDLNDQHAFLQLPDDSPLAVGDRVGLGISHPCTTFDKWRALFTVDDAYGVTGAVRTFF